MAPGTLFVVATPIGNLEDITLRALRVLRDVDVVAAEDTRRTGNLLRHYQIGTPLLSLHEHNERSRTPPVLARLKAGQSVALVSDAGTPGISDPGAYLVRAARDAGLPVTPIPGPNSVAAAISAAGLEGGRFAFGGFPPIRSKDRKEWFAWVGQLPEDPIAFFEAPHRLRKTLSDLGRLLVDRPIIVARELTKLHEEWHIGSARDLLEHFAEPRGEFILILLPGQIPKSESKVGISVGQVLRLFGQTAKNSGGGRRDAVRAVADHLGLSSREVYAAIEHAKKSGK